MIETVNDNILVKEIKKDSKAGVLRVSQDESSAYMFVEIISGSDKSLEPLGLINRDTKDILLVIQRTAKLPFIQNQFFISYKDVVSIIDRNYFERI